MAKLNQAMHDLMRYNAALLPQKRSVFDKSHSHLTSIDSAYLVPIMWDRVVPGDEKKIRYSGLARMATPIHPVMDQAFLDTWCFFIPDRLWWRHAREFYGENLDASFNPDGEYIMPYLKASQYGLFLGTPENPNGNGDGIGSLNDYFGFPKCAKSVVNNFDNDPNTYCTAGLHRCYQLIWNEYFRNSSIQPALRLNDGDIVTDDEWSVIKQIRKVCKLPDNFTMLLREPQSGSDVLLPLGEWAPVVTRDVSISSEDIYNSIPLKFSDYLGNGVNNRTPLLNDRGSLAINTDNEIVDSYPDSYLFPNNLWANLTSASATTINNLRAAITVQQFLEISNIGGKRYQQIIQAHFGTFTGDAALQRPQLLGSSRTPIGMRQVLQTSATDGVSPLGNTAAVSVTNIDNEWICNAAFTEPGFIIALCAVRPLHSYSQGIDPLLRKLNLYDHYFPVFDNLGNQPVYTSEIYGVGMDQDFNNRFTEVFGYKEAWQEYRFKQNRVSSLMRPDAYGSLASWNYSSNFSTAPVLNSEFVEENPNLIDRTIATPSEPQFLLDNYFEYFDTKNMSVKSLPGLTRL